MRQTITLALSRFYSDQCVFVTPRRDCNSLLGDGLTRHYLCNPCLGAWTPTPQRPFGAFTRFFLKGNGLTLVLTGSARQICPCNATSTRNIFFEAAVRQTHPQLAFSWFFIQYCYCGPIPGFKAFGGQPQQWKSYYVDEFPTESP